MIHLDLYTQSGYNRGRSLLVVTLWDLVQTFLIHLSPHGMYGWRRMLYRLFGAKVGRNVLIRKSARCNYPWKITIGNNSWIGDEAWLYALERITIGNNVVISQQAYLCTGSHDIEDPKFGLRTSPITIEDGSWVALGALILPGVTIAAGSVVAARSVLTKSTKPWTIYCGVPAIAVRHRPLSGKPTDSV